MAQTVSNDALWEKLSEIDKKIDGMSAMQKSLPTAPEQPENSPDFPAVKEEIIAQIKAQASLLGKHSDINFEANRNNLERVNKNVTAVLSVANHIREQQREFTESQRSAAETLKLKSAAPQAEPQPDITHHKHYYILDFKNSKAVFTMITMGLVIFISLGFNIFQADKNYDLRGNDIKYRYIKMQGETSAEELYRLESIFTFDRNKDSIRIIHKQVERYEQLVREQAEKIEQTRLNASEAQRLQNQVETVKRGI